MAHFYGMLNNGAVTRTGTRNSGIRACVKGWASGVEVCGNNRTPEKVKPAESADDVFEIYVNRGSSGKGGSMHVGTVKVMVDGSVVYEPVMETEFTQVLS